MQNYIFILFLLLNNTSGFLDKKICMDDSCPSTCQKHIHFEEIYTKERIKCEKDIECPKTIVVMATNVTKNTTFIFNPSETDQDLDFRLEIFWCGNDAFDKSKTYVRVRHHVFDEVDLLLWMCSGFMFMCLGACAPNNDALFMFMMMNKSHRRRHGRY